MHTDTHAPTGDWKKRLKQERAENDERRGKLRAFKSTPCFMQMNPIDQRLLLDQEHLMESLAESLEHRVVGSGT